MSGTRPKNYPNDEEGLLRMQEQFLAGRIPKSVIDVKSTPSSNAESSYKKKSKFAQIRERNSMYAEAAKERPQSSCFEFPQVKVLGKVVERCTEVSPSSRQVPTTQLPISNLVTQSSFPHGFHLDRSLGNPSNGSLFAQQIKKSKVMNEISNEKPTGSSTNSIENNFVTNQSIDEIETMKKEVQKENLLKLSAMTDEEIAQEQKNIVSNLDPMLVSFLKNRQTKSVKKVQEINSCSAAPEEMDLDDATIELKNSKYVHMDVVEKEKLEHWLSPLPSVKEKTDKYYQARFDFQGSLLPADLELPTTESALYHHGEEPERAGYSINELIILSRSTVLQQRVLAMNVLAKILEKTRLGIYDYCFKDCFIQSLLNGNFLLMMRHCLDDPNEAVVVAALVAFSHLVSSNLDEICLDRCFLWYRGDEQPDLCSDVQLDETDKEQECEMKDNEVAQIDVIKACLQIDILARIRYVLESIRPEPRAVLAALEILTRMCRHSVEVAESVREYPHLMDIIFRNFLPSDWSSMLKKCDNEGTTTVYGVPVPQVLRLVRAMISWNSALANRLLSQYPVIETIVVYAAIDTSGLNLPTQESLSLVLNSYHTWRVFLHHGLGVQQFIDFFPCLMKQLAYYQSFVSIEDSKNESNIRFSHQLGTAIMLMMECVLSLCCRGTRDIHFFNVSGLRTPIEICVGKWAWQMRNLSVIPPSAAALLAASIHFLITFYSHWTDEAQAMPQLNQICTGSILPLLRSDSVIELIKSLSIHSNFISTLAPCPSSVPSLPSASATVKGGQIVPVVLPSSPFQLPTAIFRLLRLWNRKCVPEQLQGKNFELSTGLLNYLEGVGKSNSTLTSNWFTRFETQFLHQLLMFQAEQRNVSYSRSTFLYPAMTLMTAATSGNESIAADCLKHIIFNRELVERHASNLEGALENMHISMPADQPLLDQAVRGLDSVADFYISQLFTPEKLVCYDVLTDSSKSKVNLTRKQHQIIPNDWIYLPLVALYQKYMNNVLPPDSTEIVIHSLEAVFVLLSLYPTWFFRILPAEHYSRLACMFLAGNDLFLDSNISGYFWPILRGISSTAMPLDFSLPINGIDDFLEFYEHLLKQYEAVSYGDLLFGTFLMLPLQQTQDVRFRLKFWIEHPDALRINGVTSQQLSGSTVRWIEPKENNKILLERYSAVLKSGLVNKQRNPLLWEIANYHST